MVDVERPNPPVTPGFDVGIVTTFAVEDAALLVVGLAAEVVVFAKVGHNAATIFPSRIIPNNVLELTDTPEQALSTLSATDSKADTQPVEHPLLKSLVVHVGI